MYQDCGARCDALLAALFVAEERLRRNIRLYNE